LVDFEFLSANQLGFLTKRVVDLSVSNATWERYGMARYYFDIENGGRAIKDNEGMELSDLKAARDAAISVLPDIAREELPDGANHDFMAWVRDASGRIVFKASLLLRSEYVDE
jgi:hypothetical protein